MWSSRTLALAINEGFVLPTKSEIPPALMNRDVAAALIVKNHSEVNDLEHLDDKTIEHALKYNWQLLTTLPPEKITEPMAFAAMDNFASVAAPQMYGNGRAYSHNDTTIKDALLRIPKRVWSKRVALRAVGNVIPLKAVPPKWRDDQMIKLAIERDPSTVTMLPDPAGFLNKNLAGHGSDDWRAAIEANGVAIIKKKFVNASSFPREQLTSGASYAVVKTGPSNVKVYFFDPKGNYVFYMWTDKDNIRMNRQDIKKAEPFRRDVVELVRRSLSGFEAGDLNELKIYGTGRSARTEEESSKNRYGEMFWSANHHKDGTMHVGYIEVKAKSKKKSAGPDSPAPKPEYKPVIRMQTETSSGGWGRGGTSRIRNVEIYDFSFCLAHSADIVNYINNKVHCEGGWQELGKLGIYFNKDKSASTVGDKTIGKIGDLTISRNDKYVGLFSPDGLIAKGTIRANGRIDKVEKIAGGFNQERVEALFAKISQVLMKDKQASGFTLAEAFRRLGRRL